MPDLNPRVLRVSRFEPGALRTISEAGQKASDGDQIVVAPGTYTLGTKKENFPIYVPPRCQLIGPGADRCFIDGGKDREIAERPLNPFQSLVLLGDQATISGITIRNSGGNGLATEQSARVLITKNVIRDNAQHGLLVFGTNGALIRDNQFINNGTARRQFGGPRPGIGRQGHHIYIEGRIDCANEVSIIDNTMEKVYADAIANDMYDQPDGMAMSLQIVGNEISACERNGMSIVSSYSPSKTNVVVNIQDNKISGSGGNAIDLVASYSIVNRTLSDATLVANVVRNEIKGGVCGILAVGAYEASVNCKARYNIIKNIVGGSQFGIRVVGGYNLDELKGWDVKKTLAEAVVVDNTISDTSKTPLLIQGGIKEKKGIVQDNTLYVHIIGNEVFRKGKRQNSGKGLVIRHGERKSNNCVIILEGSTKRVVTGRP